MAPSLSSRTAEKDAAAGGFEINEALREVAVSATGRRSFYKASLQALAKHYGAPYAALHLDLPSGSIDEVVKHGSKSDDQWTRIADEVLLDVRYRGYSVAKMIHATGIDRTFAVMGLPVTDPSIVGGSLVVVTACGTKELAEAKLAELKSLQAQISTVVTVVEKRKQANSKRPSDSSRRSAAKEASALARVNQFESIHELAFSITNGMKSQLEYDQVSFGLVQDKHVRLLSISGHDSIQKRNPGVRLIVDAMEECLDAGKRLVYDEVVEGTDVKQNEVLSNHFLHKRWFWEAGKTAVATLPLFLDEQCVAVLAFQQRPSSRINKTDLDKVKSTLEPLMPGALLLERASQSALRQLLSEWRNVGRRFLSRGRGGVALLCLCGAFGLIFGRMNYRVTVPCTVSSSDVRHLAAPFPGKLVRSAVEAGQVVEEGQVLVEFDTRELSAQRFQLLADLRVADLNLGEKLNGRDALGAAQATGEIDSLRAQLQLVQSRIGRAVVRAPFDGIVLSGDPKTRVGEVVALGDPLCTLGPIDSLELELATPEHAAPLVKPSHEGYFVSQSHPDRRYPFGVKKMDVSSSTVDGQTVYVAKARLNGESPKSLRMGMTGFARVTTDRQPVWWILSHKIIDTLRLQAWKL